jgi:hypothetical protein
MVSEDPETYDIHADLMGGWPGVVRDAIYVSKFQEQLKCIYCKPSNSHMMQELIK